MWVQNRNEVMREERAVRKEKEIRKAEEKQAELEDKRAIATKCFEQW